MRKTDEAPVTDSEVIDLTLAESSKAWGVPVPTTTTVFDFRYTEGRDQLLRLYDKGTRKQWVG